MKRLLLIAAAAFALFGLAPTTSLAAFGFEEVDVTFTGPDGAPAMQAGSHPFALTTTLRLNTVEESGLEAPDGDLKDLYVDYPPGLVAIPSSVPRCAMANFLQIEGSENACPNSPVVGVAEVTASTSGPVPAGSGDFLDPFPIYNLTPPEGAAARIGAVVAGLPIVAELGLTDVPPHNGFAWVPDISAAILFYSARITLWGVPANPAHDPDRGHCAFLAGICPVNVSQVPFLTVPRSCTGPVETYFEASSRQDPDQWVFASASSHDNAKPPNPLGLTDCAKLGFSPRIDVQPTTDRAESPSGLDVSIDVYDEGLTNPAGIAQSDIEEAILILPKGMVASPSLTKGHATCTLTQYEQEAIDSEPGQGCPQASEIGTIEVETPLLAGEILEGQLFLAQPDDPATPEPGAENPFDSLLALYVMIEHPELGVLIKQAGMVEPDPVSGQLIGIFEQLPQLPFSHLRLYLHEGNSGPLITPLECGEFTAKAIFTPWAHPNQSLIATTSFQISHGIGGGPCSPAGTPPLSPYNPPPVSPAFPGVNSLPPAKARPCAKGKRRVVRGKARCVRKRCLPRRAKIAPLLGRGSHGEDARLDGWRDREAWRAPVRRCAGSQRRGHVGTKGRGRG